MPATLMQSISALCFMLHGFRIARITEGKDVVRKSGIIAASGPEMSLMLDQDSESIQDKNVAREVVIGADGLEEPLTRMRHVGKRSIAVTAHGNVEEVDGVAMMMRRHSLVAEDGTEIDATTPSVNATQACSKADTDRWWPNLGGCCSDAVECTEPRPTDDVAYCPASHPNHLISCWSTVQMCRVACTEKPTESPTIPPTPSPTPSPTGPTPSPTACVPRASWTNMNTWFSHRNARDSDCHWMCSSDTAADGWCIFYKFSSSDEGTCKLYDCYPKTGTRPQLYERIQNCGSGMNLSSTVAASVDACQALCNNRDGCAGFESYWTLNPSKANQGEAPCHLKASCNGSPDTSGWGSGYKKVIGECSSRYTSATCGPVGGCYWQGGTCQPYTRYVPGQPGAAWRPEIFGAMRGRLYLTMIEGKNAAIEAGTNQGLGMFPSMAKYLRLAFHDCLRYTDGSGGCDGCLDWTYVGKRGGVDEIGNGSDGSNNGLQPAVEVLEQIYTNRDFPFETYSLPIAPIDMGISRADLWAFAAMVAVEMGIELSNIACRTGATGITYTNFNNCHPRVGEPDCVSQPPRAFNFATGRRDCVPSASDSRVDKPYKTFKKESHPFSGANGSETLEFMKREFSFNGRETIAIMGAHTLGRLHNEVSHHKYVWTTMSGSLFNNMYYRNMADRVAQDWYYPSGDDTFPNGTSIRYSAMVDTNCKGVGNSTGGRPLSRWRTNANGDLPKSKLWPRCSHRFNADGCVGGPSEWIQEQLVCPCFRVWADMAAYNRTCNSSDAMACPPGTEQWLFVKAVDQSLLNSDIGLYRNFSQIVGLPYNGGACPGLEVGMDWPAKHSTASMCPYNTIQDPPSDLPMYQIVESYALDNTLWLSDFFPAFEKMLSNGYSSSELSAVPMPAFTCQLHRNYMCTPQH